MQSDPRERKTCDPCFDLEAALMVKITVTAENVEPDTKKNTL